MRWSMRFNKHICFYYNLEAHDRPQGPVGQALGHHSAASTKCEIKC